jgi:hypothetical protein
MVRIRDIKDDYYTFDENNSTLVGAYHKSIITIR